MARGSHNTSHGDHTWKNISFLNIAKPPKKVNRERTEPSKLGHKCDLVMLLGACICLCVSVLFCLFTLFQNVIYLPCGTVQMWEKD